MLSLGVEGMDGSNTCLPVPQPRSTVLATTLRQRVFRRACPGVMVNCPGRCREGDHSPSESLD